MSDFSSKIRVQKSKNMADEIKKVMDLDEEIYKALIASER